MIDLAVRVILKVKDFQARNPSAAVIQKFNHIFDFHIAQVKRNPISGMQLRKPVDKLAWGKTHQFGHFSRTFCKINLRDVRISSRRKEPVVYVVGIHPVHAFNQGIYLPALFCPGRLISLPKTGNFFLHQRQEQTVDILGKMEQGSLSEAHEINKGILFKRRHLKAEFPVDGMPVEPVELLENP